MMTPGRGLMGAELPVEAGRQGGRLGRDFRSLPLRATSVTFGIVEWRRGWMRVESSPNRSRTRGESTASRAE